MLYAWSIGLAKDVAYLPNIPSSQATRSHPRKAKSYEPMVLNESILPMKRKKSITISHTQYETTPISTPILTKMKEWGREKQRRPTPGARKCKQI